MHTFGKPTMLSSNYKPNYTSIREPHYGIYCSQCPEISTSIRADPLCMFSTAAPTTIHTSEPSQIFPRVSPRTGVYPGTFQTFIDLRGIEDEGPPLFQFSKPFATSPPSNSPQHSYTGTLVIPDKGTGKSREIHKDGHTRQQSYSPDSTEALATSNIALVDATGHSPYQSHTFDIDTKISPTDFEVSAPHADATALPEVPEAINQPSHQNYIGYLLSAPPGEIHQPYENASTESEDHTHSDPLSSKRAINKLSVSERKKIIVSSDRPPKVTKSMQSWVSNTNALFDPFRDDDDCWFHPSPPRSRLTTRGSLRSCGKIQKSFAWQDRQGKHSIVLNYGIVSKLINFKMSKQQKDGFINKQWHLSHLCGNWTCLNPTHTTVEPGLVNIGRNNCFSHRAGCFHNPPCLKEKKVPLGADGRLLVSSRLEGVDVAQNPDEHDHWVLDFDEGDEFMRMGDSDSDSVVGLLENSFGGPNPGN